MMTLDTDNTSLWYREYHKQNIKKFKELLICCDSNYINQQLDKGKMSD